MLSDCKSDRTLPKDPRAYLGSAPRLFPKRPVLISEAPGAYFGSAGRFCCLSAPFYSFFPYIIYIIAKVIFLFTKSINGF